MHPTIGDWMASQSRSAECTLLNLSTETPSPFLTGRDPPSGTSRVSGQGPTATHVAPMGGSRTSAGSGAGTASALDASLTSSRHAACARRARRGCRDRRRAGRHARGRGPSGGSGGCGGGRRVPGASCLASGMPPEPLDHADRSPVDVPVPWRNSPCAAPPEGGDACDVPWPEAFHAASVATWRPPLVSRRPDRPPSSSLARRSPAAPNTGAGSQSHLVFRFPHSSDRAWADESLRPPSPHRPA